MNTKTETMVVRWTISGFVIGAFAILCLLLTKGGIDETATLMLTPKWVVKMPFSVSGWWNLFLVPIVAISIIAILRADKAGHRKEFLTILMVIGLISGLALAELFGKILGILISFGFNIIIAVVWILVRHFFFRTKYLNSILQTILLSYFIGLGNALSLPIIPGLLLVSISTVVGTIIAVLILNTVLAIRGLRGLSAHLPVVIHWVRGIDIEEESEIETEKEEE